MRNTLILFLVFIQISCIIPEKVAITSDYIMGKFVPAKHPDFIKIEATHTAKPDMYLRKEAYESFKKMYAAAEKEGVKLTIISATRNFEYQKGIWEKKWKALTLTNEVSKAKKILEYSAMPGCSRHHWGTDIDIVNLSNPYFEKNGGKEIYDWLVKNAATYGFCQPYTAGRSSGYNEEKWHWTYMPLSKKFTEFAEKNLKDNMIKGFLGAETAMDIKVVKNYVLGINKACF
jgi:zinc D-Ala-D-Ala carboxypeptidase